MQHIFHMILGFFAQFLAKKWPQTSPEDNFFYDHLVYIYYLWFLPTGILFMDSLLANEFFQTMSTDPSQYLTPSLKENVKEIY